MNRENINIELKQKLDIALRKNDHALLVKALKNGARIYLDDPTMLFKAVKNGYAEIVETLVEYGCDIETEDESALRLAVIHNHQRIAQFLIDSGSDVNSEYGLYPRLACSYGHLDMLKLLEKNGVNYVMSGQECLEYAISNNYIEIVKHLIEKLETTPNIGYVLHKKKDSPLSIAALRERLDIVKYLISKGADVSQTGYEAVRYAAFVDSVEMISYFSELVDLDKVQFIAKPEVQQWLDKKRLHDSLGTNLLDAKVQNKKTKL